MEIVSRIAMILLVPTFAGLAGNSAMNRQWGWFGWNVGFFVVELVMLIKVYA